MNIDKYLVSLGDIEYAFEMLEAMNDVDAHHCKDSDDTVIRKYLCIIADANTRCFDALNEEDANV